MLINVGISMLLQESKENSKKLINASVYNAPEVNSNPGDPRSDVWSLGIVCYMFLSGSYPYDVSDITTFDELKYQIANKDFGKEITIDQDLMYASNECKDFIISCLERDLSKRPSVDTLLQHPWLSMKVTLEMPETRVQSIFLKFITVDKSDLEFCSIFSSNENLHTRVRELFTKISEGKTTITLRDFYKVLKKHKLSILSHESERLHRKLNTTGDKQLTCEKFLEGANTMAIFIHLKKIDKLFKECDIDCHGFITNDNIKKCMEKWNFSASEAALFTREIGIDGYDYIKYCNIRKYARKTLKLVFK